MDDASTTDVVKTKHSTGKAAAVDHTAQSTNLAQLVRASTTIPAGASVFRHMNVLVTKNSVKNHVSVSALEMEIVPIDITSTNSSVSVSDFLAVPRMLHQHATGSRNWIQKHANVFARIAKVTAMNYRNSIHRPAPVDVLL